MEYVLAAELSALLGPGADAARVTTATDAANQLIGHWVELAAPAPVPLGRRRWWRRAAPRAAGDNTYGSWGVNYGSADTTDTAVRTAAQAQAGLELAHQLYRRHAAVGGIFTVDELVARLPADLTRGIRDLLDADTHWWGVA